MKKYTTVRLTAETLERVRRHGICGQSVDDVLVEMMNMLDAGYGKYNTSPMAKIRELIKE